MPDPFRRSFLGALAGMSMQSAVSCLHAAEVGPDVDDECRAGLASLEPQTAGGGERFAESGRGARRNGFVRPSLVIELDDLYVEPSDGFLRGPRCFGQPFVRVYVHETMHFWQTLSAGFLTNLALQEWDLLNDFRANGKAAEHRSLIERFVESPADAPFSAWELSEALCRYWDIHVLGPVRLLRAREDPMATDSPDFKAYSQAEFERAMTIDDAYAAPYRWATAHWGGKASVLLFPLVGYFALQTQKPVDVFLRVAEEMRDSAQQLGGSIHINWRRIYPEVRKRCDVACFAITGSLLTPGWDVIRRSGLRESPVWRPYLQRLNQAILLQGGRSMLDLAFSLPGDPEYRGVLTSAFVPAVTLFRDGRWIGRTRTPLTPVRAASSAASTAEDQRASVDAVAREIADAAEQVLADYREMKQAALMSRFPDRSTKQPPSR